MLQRLGIRGKILAVVAVPILVLVLAAAFITVSASQTYSAARNSEDLIATLGSARGLESDLQEERFLSSTFAHMVQDGEDKLDEAYGYTDTSLANLEEAVAAEATNATADGGEDGESVVVDGDALLADVDAAINRTASGYMEDARAVQIAAPAEEGGWAVFPAADQIEAMQAAYAEAVAAVDAIADSLPAASDLDIPLGALSFRLNFESESATALFTEPLPYEEQLQAVWADVDAGVQGLLGSSERLASNEDNARAVEALLSGQEAVASLPSTRAAVRATTVNVSAMINGYTSLIGTIVTAADDVSVAMNERDLVTSIQAYGDLDALIEDMRYEEVMIDRLIRTGAFLPGEAASARTMTARTDIALQDAQSSSAAVPGAEDVPSFGASAGVVDGTASSFQTVRTQVLTGLDASLVAEQDSDWPTEVDTEVAAYEPLREDLWTGITADASASTQTALTQALLTGLAAIAIVIVSIIIALVIARRIIGPLRRLTTTATAVQQELPRLVERVALPGEDVDVTEVQIPVESRDEVGQLAEAFNGVNATTLSIAAEQSALRGSISEMFVNVARRDQVLLNRQLSSIDEMERTEDDPTTLTKLFALDHLATRMRRNSESLLVLAGIDTGRRLRRPMPLSDVIRTASSEIEMYERVDLELNVDPEMLGHTALTAAHLFAELLENATVFSDPGTRVAVRTGATDSGFSVEVEDHGIGMTEAEVAEANARVGSTAASEILGEQRLGLFVVGRIARRVGASVEVRSEEGRGTVAVVSLPASLFTGAAEAPAPAPSAAAVSMAVDADAPAGSLTPPAPAPATARDIAAGPAYTPAAVGEGDALAGRSGALPARGGALPSRGGEPEPSIDALIAADAEAAPAAEATDPEALTEGTSTAGLPTRRRRAAEASSADDATGAVPVVGLPARATDEQLSALDAESSAGFTPTVAPSEVAPQSPADRASVFRGFRSRREAEQIASESLGQTSRREGVAHDDAPEPFTVPGLVDDDVPEVGTAPEAVADSDSGGAAALGAAAFFSARSRAQAQPTPKADAAPGAQWGDAPVADVPVFAQDDEPALAADDATGVGDDTADSTDAAEEPQAPAYALEPDADSGTAGFRLPKFDPTTTGQIPVIRDEEPQPESFAIPGLEDDAEPAASAEVPVFEDDAPAAAVDADQEPDAAPEFASSPWPAFAPEPAPEPVDATDQPVAQQTWPAPSEPEGAQPDAVQPHAVQPEQDDKGFATPSWARVSQPEQASQPSAGVEEVALDETVESDGAPEVSEAAAITAGATAGAAAAPQLNDLIQSAVEDDHRPGFFSRLFGRGNKDQASSAAAPAAQSAPAPSAPSAPAVFAPVTSMPPLPAQAPASLTPAEPGAAWLPPVPPAAEAVSAEEAAWNSAVSAEDAPAPSAPSAAPTAFAPLSFAPEPVQESAQQHVQEVAPEPEPQAFTPEPAPAPQAFTPEEFAPEPAAEPVAEAEPQAYAPQAFEPEPQAAAEFTPEQLAQAHGWEAAGESALQAAQPEQVTSYQPIIQPEPRGEDDVDFTSAAFSELSSLASERPKIEKTRAGLQKRRASDAPPVEVTPLEEEVSVAPSERDADAVRNRFSAFYSGTKRARQDAEDFDRATRLEENATGGQD